MSDEFEISVFYCKLIRNKPHLIKNPKILPCLNTACAKCIEKLMTKKNFFKCDFLDCNERHELKEIPNNDVLNKYMFDNLKQISKYVNESFLWRYNELDGMHICVVSPFQ